MALSQNYHVGHEGFFAIAPETSGAPSPAATTTSGLTPPSAFQLAGYTDLPEISNDRGATGVKAVASPHEVDAFQTQNDYTFNSQITLCASASGPTGVARTIIGAACRSTEENWTYRVLGLPLVCVATGFINDYSDSQAETTLGRFSLVNSLKISAKEKAAVTAEVELWPLFVQAGADVTSASLGGDTDPEAPNTSLFGEALTWNTLSLKVGGTEYRSVISSVDIDIKNNCVRSGVRPIYPQVEGVDSPLSLTPYSVKPGVQTSTLQLELHTELAPELKQREVGTVELKASGYFGATERTLTVTIPNVTFTQGSRQKTSPDDGVTYSASFLARKVMVAWD